MLLDGQVAFVTGGARGIGRAVAERFAAEGAGVMVGDVDLDAASEVAHAASQNGHRIEAVAVDVTDTASLEAAADACEERLGPAGILVANAGVLHLEPVLDLPLETWRRVLDVNLTGAFLSAKVFAARMVRRGAGGRIVFTSSLYGRRGGRENAAYSAGKFGVVALAESLAAELAADDVRGRARRADPARPHGQPRGDRGRLRLPRLAALALRHRTDRHRRRRPAGRSLREGVTMDRSDYERRRGELDGLLSRGDVLRATAAGAAVLAAPTALGATARAATRTRPETAAAPAARKGGTLVFAVDALTGNSDPAIFATFGNWMAIDCLARGLTHIDYHTTTVQPALARSWDENKAGTVYRFHLRSGLTFHDGNPVTANDCARTFKRLMDPKDPSRPPGTYSIAELGGSNVKAVKAVDDETFEIRLAQRDVAFLARLSNPNGVILSAAAIDRLGKKIGTRLVGAGPFKFVSSTPGQSINMEAFDDFYGGRPSLDKVVLQVLPDPSALTSALQSGQAQASNFVPFSTVSALKKNQRLEVREGRRYIDIFIGMNAGVPLLKDLRVRQAINYCVDRKAIVQQALSGQAVLPAGLIAPPELGYDKRLMKYSTQDLPKARSLLRAAGANGKTVSLVNRTSCSGRRSGRSSSRTSPPWG
jgi:NAD(P)-dependent dehydrogenase (short-subunit alcohol dehydrogenase family)